MGTLHDISARVAVLRDAAFTDALGDGPALHVVVPGVGTEEVDYVTLHAANRVVGYSLHRLDRADDEPNRRVNVALVRSRLRRYAITELNLGAYRVRTGDGGHVWGRAVAVRPCNGNTGGDPTSGCEIPAMASRDVCWWHARAEAALSGGAA